MKKPLLSLLAFMLLSVCASAQTLPKGYYRVQNFLSHRYIFLTDDKTKGADIQANKFDIDALRSYGPFSRVVSDPSTVFYIEHYSGYEYNLKGQGKDAHQFAGRYLTVKPVTYKGKTYYTASGTYAGVTKYLGDGTIDTDRPNEKGYLTIDGTMEQNLWDIIPVNASSDNYFGITPEVTANGQRYAAFFASFPFKPVSSDMKVYTVTKVDGAMAVITEVQGAVAAGAPVIIACPSADVAANRIDILMQDVAKPVGNVLSGQYFNSTDFYPTPAYPHYNAKAWDAATMRILGTTKEGRLGFVKNTNLTTVPRNKAYLMVSATAPDEITLMTKAEYDEEKAKAPVTVQARSYSRAYGDANPTFEYDVVDGSMEGQPAITCAATATSPVGDYPIVVSQGTVTSTKFTGINSTLTVTKAPLTVTARSYTIKQNEPMPKFEADMTGFKNGETTAVLTAQPQLSCSVPESMFIPVGTYEITVSGADAQNYSFSYVAGTLTVIQADPITLTVNNATMEYGDEVPQFTYAISGGAVEGTPVITCEATNKSAVGSYDITVQPGTIVYPNLVLQNGTLTIAPATLTASVGNYSRNKGEANPEFVITYEGFKNGETADVLTTRPTATCEANADSAPGKYDIIVSGGQAANYTFAYVNGILEVKDTQGISAVTVSLQRPADIFTLDGRCVRRAATTTAGLPRGMYIIEGRKVVVR